MEDNQTPIRADRAVVADENGNGNQELHDSMTEALAELALKYDDDDLERMRTLRIAFVGNVDSGKSSLIGMYYRALCIHMHTGLRIVQRGGSPKRTLLVL